VIATMAVRMLMAPLWETTAPFALFMFATVLTAWVAGFGTALLTGTCSIIIRLYFDLPQSDGWGVVTWEKAVRLSLFAGFVFGCATLLTRMRCDREDLETSMRQAHHELQERRRAEAALRESEQRLRELADAMPQIVWDLVGAVRSVVETHASAASRAGIRLQLNGQSEPLVVWGDESRLQQVVRNLLSNALKFTPSGGHVDVQVCGNNGSAERTVLDSGSGIAPDFLPHLFERFIQAETELTRQHGGLGLGLPIARYIVELHGGSVSAHSDGQNRGARFTVRLPLYRAGTERDRSPEEPSDRDGRMGPGAHADALWPTRRPDVQVRPR
jgi:K+-sensing histidine kinase KdpD